MALRSARNYDRNQASRETGLACTQDEDMTQQQFKDDADINVIVKRYGITGKVPGNLAMPLPDDFHAITDFHEAANIMRRANEEFMRVPADLRARFGNDPGRLVGFLGDERNRDEAIRLGLVNPPPEVDRTGGPLPPAPPEQAPT